MERDLGRLEKIILGIIGDGVVSRHGAAILAHLRQTVGGYEHPSRVYGALYRLRDKGLLHENPKEPDGKSGRTGFSYSLTPAGKVAWAGVIRRADTGLTPVTEQILGLLAGYGPQGECAKNIFLAMVSLCGDTVSLNGLTKMLYRLEEQGLAISRLVLPPPGFSGGSQRFFALAPAIPALIPALKPVTPPSLPKVEENRSKVGVMLTGRFTAREYAAMRALRDSGGETYVAAIDRVITGSSCGSLLQRLERVGLVTSRVEDVAGERGRARRFYKLTPEGDARLTTAEKTDIPVLTALAQDVLMLVRAQDGTAYSRSIFMALPNTGNIFSLNSVAQVLRNLESRGMLMSREAPGKGQRSRRVYTVTAVGHEALNSIAGV